MRLVPLLTGARGGSDPLGLPTFAYKPPSPFYAYWEDFDRGVSTTHADLQSAAGASSGGAWYFLRASTTETVGMFSLDGGAVALSGTTTGNRITLIQNRRATTGAGNIGVSETDTTPIVFATRFRISAVATAVGFVGFTTQNTATMTPGFTSAGFGGMGNGVGFYFDGTDLIGTTVTTGAVDGTVTLQAAPSANTFYKCEAVVRPLGTGLGVSTQFYLNGVAVGSPIAAATASSWGIVGPTLELSQTVTATRTMVCDYVYAAKGLSAAR